MLQFDMGSGCQITMGDDGLCSSKDVQQRVHRTIESNDGHIWCAPWTLQCFLSLNERMFPTRTLLECQATLHLS